MINPNPDGGLPHGSNHGASVVNTAIIYQYRDAANNKVAHQVIFSGSLSDDVRSKIQGSLVSLDADEQHFIPGQVGLPDLQMSFLSGSEPLRWYPDDDIWHELCGISETISPATQVGSIADFAELVARTKWDEEYRPPFHAEMVENYEKYVAACDQDPSL
ncbi:hypothetical protein KUV57_12010 [Epibacterium sp. DP7N7-1]|nr:hypothetical protein [Epibacterium sp. DP7N7-1]